MIIDLLELLTINFIFSLSILGYSFSFLNYSGLKLSTFKDFYSIYFLIGFFISSICVLILIFFIPISDNVSILFHLSGIILLFSLNFNKINKKLIKHIFYIIIIASFFSFYSLESDDFSYHLRSTLYFKEQIIINDLINKIEDGPRVAYNSIWFIVNSLIAIKIFNTSFFFISSIFFASIVFDFYREIKKNENYNQISTLYIFFALIFILSILGQYKNFGSDTPGQLIIILLIFIFFKKFNFFQNFDNHYFFLILILMIFACMIKITNILILPLLFFIFYKTVNKLYIIGISLVISIPFFLWIYTNYKISGCLFFPLEISCFHNIQKATYYNLAASAFAKSVLNENIPIEQSEILMSNYGWIKYWINDHFKRIIEKIILFLLLLSFPLIFIKIKFYNKLKLINIFKLSGLKKFEIYNYYLFSIVSLFQLTLWFFIFPSFRFGSSYILNFIIIFILPLWINFYKIDKNFYKKYKLTLLSVSIFYFTYNNIIKIFKYIERENYIWPIVEKCEIFNFSRCPNIF